MFDTKLLAFTTKFIIVDSPRIALHRSVHTKKRRIGTRRRWIAAVLRSARLVVTPSADRRYQLRCLYMPAIDRSLVFLPSTDRAGR